MKTKYIGLVIITFIILFSACHKRQELEYFEGYENYDRTVGVDGKEMFFYETMEMIDLKMIPY